MLYRGSLCPSKNFRFQVRRLVELWATVGFPLHQLARQPQPQPAAQKDPQSPVVHGGRDPSIRGSRRTKPGCQLASAHVKQTPMCAKPRIGRACRRLRMSLSGLWLHHGLRGGCAAREPEAVTGATPIFRCLVWHLGGLGCALHPNPPRGSLRVHQSFAGRPARARSGCIPTWRRGLPRQRCRCRPRPDARRFRQRTGRRNPAGGRCVVADA